MFKIKNHSTALFTLTIILFFLTGLILFLVYVCQLKTITLFNGQKVTIPISRDPLYASFAFIITAIICSMIALQKKMFSESSTAHKLSVAVILLGFIVFALDILFSVWTPYSCPDGFVYNTNLKSAVE
jgi:hypothetical protein